MNEPRHWSSALLTGATHGIGQATARRLAPSIDLLLLHGPEAPGDVRALLAELRGQSPATTIEYFQADYGRLEDVASLITAVTGRVDRLDLLINNAGRPGAATRTASGDGNEQTLQTNFLAPVALTTGLLGRLEAPARARVVNVASATHYSAELWADDLGFERHPYSAVAAYARSKLALVTYTCWLADRLRPTGVEAASLHPGVIATDLLHAMFGPGGDSVDVAARNIMHLVTAHEDVNGEYFDESRPAAPHADARDPARQRELIEATSAVLEAAGLEAPAA